MVTLGSRVNVMLDTLVQGIYFNLKTVAKNLRVVLFIMKGICLGGF